MFQKTFFIALFFFFLPYLVNAQTFPYYHYTSSDGLASSTVFNIIQDRKGFIWFATINGLSKFDGKNFSTFRTGDGLNSNSIISLVEGGKGELYIANHEKGINVLRNGRIENYCSEIDGRNFTTSYLLLAHSGKDQQTLYTYRSSGSITSFVEDKKGGLITSTIYCRPFRLYKMEMLPKGDIIALTLTGLASVSNNGLTKLDVKGLPETPVYCLTDGGDGSYLIGTNGMIYRIKNNGIIGRYKIKLFAKDNDVMSMLRDKNNNLWFSVMNRGFFLIPNGSDTVVDVGRKMDLQNTLVNNYLEDNEGNIWISTFGKGVYCLNNLYLKNYNENDGMSNNNVYAIAKEKSGKLLIGTFNGVNLYDNGQFDRIKSNLNKIFTEYIHGIKNFNNEIYIYGSFAEQGIKNIFYKGIKLHLFAPPSFCRTTEGLYLFGSWDNFITSSKVLDDFNKESTQRFPVFGDSVKRNRLNEIFEDSQKNLWVGTSLGLCKISDLKERSGKMDGRKTFFPDNPVLNSKINAIYQDNEENIWFAGDKGIASYNLKDDSVRTFTTIKSYDLSSSTSIVSDSRKRIWIGNMKGLFLLDGKSVKYLTRQTGLPSDEVYQLYYDKGKNFLYIGTSNGISFLDISLFDNYVPPSLEVKIFTVKAGDSVYTNFDNLVFKPEHHNVFIEFGAITLSSPGSVKYKYKLNNEWAETDHGFLDFVSLEKGKYKLEIMAKSQNGEWGKPSEIKFEIQPRYYETLWFKLGRILFVVLISISLVRWRWMLKNKKIRNELELSDRINELKHQALSAMMNPHFIFNALNSVQYLINCKRNEEANNYIAMMAQLVRKNLDTAGSGFILLSEEISRLKLYLDLEKLRFQEDFSYEVVTGAEVVPNCILIPNMIIQPFVENSLWHGIVHSAAKGFVSVSFSFEEVDIDSTLNRALVIKITDNGIGIQEAQKNKIEDHISKGIEIVEERLRLLSTKMQLPKPIMLEDLSNHNNFSHGTEVIISLPLPLYKIVTPW